MGEKTIYLKTVTDETNICALIVGYIMKRRKFFRLIDSRSMKLLMRGEYDYEQSAMLYSAAIMKNTEEPGWRVKHVAMATGLSEETSEQVLHLVECYVGTAQALSSALYTIRKEQDKPFFNHEQRKLMMSYELRLQNLRREQEKTEEPRIQLRPTDFMNTYEMCTEFFAKEGEITIIWE